MGTYLVRGMGDIFTCRGCPQVIAAEHNRNTTDAFTFRSYWYDNGLAPVHYQWGAYFQYLWLVQDFYVLAVALIPGFGGSDFELTAFSGCIDKLTIGISGTDLWIIKSNRYIFHFIAVRSDQYGELFIFIDAVRDVQVKVQGFFHYDLLEWVEPDIARISNLELDITHDVYGIAFGETETILVFQDNGIFRNMCYFHDAVGVIFINSSKTIRNLE